MKLSPDGSGAVTQFVEKPCRSDAAELIKQENVYWNAGIFLFAADAMLASFQQEAPGILDACRRALDGAVTDLDFLRLSEEAYGDAEDISFDYAILEKSNEVTCVPLHTAWSDIGSWNAIWSANEKGADGNVSLGKGRSLFHEAKNSFVYSDKQLVSVVGLDDVLVVSTEDAVLVASRDQAEKVKSIVDRLRADGSPEGLLHTRVHRPWGWYERVSAGERFLVKCIMVKPGGALSLQSHYHRSEHWVVVSGTAEVTKGNQTRLLSENESTFIQIGEPHRLANPGKIPAYLIEVQSGAYIGEDDIERFDDSYGRFTAD
jgi:mannose-1-phosphate guanylyltransferase/mannose-6-phosphate isomerase